MNKSVSMRKLIFYMLLMLTLLSICIEMYYNPLLYIVGNDSFRKDDWESIKHVYFPTSQYTKSDEIYMIKQRSLEDLVLFQAKKMGIDVSDQAIQQQLNQLGKTKEERAVQLKQLKITEEESKQNIRRSMIGFQVKNHVTKNIVITQDEIKNFYLTHLEAFKIPELRTIRYIRVKDRSNDLVQISKYMNEKNFKNIFDNNRNNKNIYGEWSELIPQLQMKDKVGLQVSTKMFQATKNKLYGPIRVDDWIYWFQVERIEPPRQQPLSEVNQKIYSTLLFEKQKVVLQDWLEAKKKTSNYRLFIHNLSRDPLIAFIYDFPVNVQLIFSSTD
ncbi:peptidylprolyl isomerase [Thermoflavimicrobium dichotomicum]|uniref:peptidylprolyl isomerase n=1 Tax=Thermoflavimicrobium dichotomicum TaxID=46223 RepID=A0A1I3PWE2_9BACL|nr:peptidylprolyl isomerase [Thermoflavimicrobium dichotomicum]SFJ25587.1 PPIC-type PPIASE domain-containing protein [Thermoflavimicrobium dichotomicum]